MKISAGKGNVLALIVMMLEALSGFAICPLYPSGSVQPSVWGRCISGGYHKSPLSSSPRDSGHQAATQSHRLLLDVVVRAELLSVLTTGLFLTDYISLRP